MSTTGYEGPDDNTPEVPQTSDHYAASIAPGTMGNLILQIKRNGEIVGMIRLLNSSEGKWLQKILNVSRPVSAQTDNTES